MFTDTQTLVKGRGIQLEARTPKCSQNRDETGHRCQSRKPADSSDKVVVRWHCHGESQSSTTQNHTSTYFSLDSEFNRPRTNLFEVPTTCQRNSRQWREMNEKIITVLHEGQNLVQEFTNKQVIYLVCQVMLWEKNKAGKGNRKGWESVKQRKETGRAGSQKWGRYAILNRVVKPHLRVDI